jgi:hypothetical protein
MRFDKLLFRFFAATTYKLCPRKARGEVGVSLCRAVFTNQSRSSSWSRIDQRSRFSRGMHETYVNEEIPQHLYGYS